LISDNFDLKINTTTGFRGGLETYVTPDTYRVLEQIVESARNQYDEYFDPKYCGSDILYFLLFKECAVALIVYSDKNDIKTCGYMIRNENVGLFWADIEETVLTLMFNKGTRSDDPKCRELFSETLNSIQPFSFIYCGSDNLTFPIDVKKYVFAHRTQGGFSRKRSVVPLHEIQNHARREQKGRILTIKDNEQQNTTLLNNMFSRSKPNKLTVIFKEDKYGNGIYADIQTDKTFPLSALWELLS